MLDHYPVSIAPFIDLSARELALQNAFDYASPEFHGREILGVLPAAVLPVTVVLLGFAEPTADREVGSAIRSHGLRDATVHELLAFSLQHPDVARASPVVTRRPICVRGSARDAVPCLLGDARRRDLMMLRPLDVWSASYRFACVAVTS